MQAKVLTIAGSDPSGGAGVQADLRTITVLGAYGMSVITALTVQTPARVHEVFTVPAALVKAQLKVVLDSVGADAIKTGMLGSPEIVATVAEVIEARPGTPLVVDPVMVATAGGVLLEEDALKVLLERLLPLARVMTPNRPEIEKLTGLTVSDLSSAKQACRRLFAVTGSPVLLKGGHSSEVELVDLLFEGSRFQTWSHARLGGDHGSFHGTGCALSAAIATRLAKGMDLVKAIDKSIVFLQKALRNAFSLDEGPPVPDVL